MAPVGLVQHVALGFTVMTGHCRYADGALAKCSANGFLGNRLPKFVRPSTPPIGECGRGQMARFPWKVRGKSVDVTE